MKHLKYLRYVLRHKWYVFLECCKLGIPWLGIIHDLSKLSTTEWGPYAENFFGTKPYDDPCSVGEDFDLAWLNHQRHNKHHWQYWILRGDADSEKVLPMPDRYRREMLADWRGAGRAISGVSDPTSWYLANEDKMLLHQDTRRWVEYQLGLLDEERDQWWK